MSVPFRSSPSSASLPSPPRSIAWRIQLGTLPRHETASRWTELLAAERAKYVERKYNVLRAPDGRLPPDVNAGYAERRGEGREESPLDVNNPLSLAEESPWHAYYAKLTTIEQIQKDVERVFPDEEESRFASEGRSTFSQHLATTLAVWSCSEENAHIGYRQGMHEVAALCWICVKQDTIESPEEHEMLLAIRWLEEDLFTLFDALMKKLSPLYEWRQSGHSPLPILRHCELVQESLQANDVELSRHLTRLAIPVQLYAIRWLRLLFSREVALDVALDLWDALLDVDPSLHLVDHMCVALLQRIRSDLLVSDNAGALRILLGMQSSVIASSASARILMDEARQAHRRCMAVRSGFETVDVNGKQASDGIWNRRYSSLGHRSTNNPFTSTNSFPSSSATLPDFARNVNAQALGAGLFKAFNNVQSIVSEAYQAQIAGQSRRSTQDDGFPPLMDDVSKRQLSSLPTSTSLPRTPFPRSVGTGSSVHQDTQTASQQGFQPSSASNVQKSTPTDNDPLGVGQVR